MSRSLTRRSARAGVVSARSHSASTAVTRVRGTRFESIIRRTGHYSAAGRNDPQPPDFYRLQSPIGSRGAPRLCRGATNAGGFGGPFRGPPFSNNREAGGGEQVLRVDWGRCHTHRGRCRRAALETESALNGHDELEVQAVAGVARDDVPVDRPPEQG